MGDAFDDFIFLLPHFLNEVESAKGTTFPTREEWKVDGDRLAVKYGANLLSIADLMEGTKPNVPNFNIAVSFIDFMSIYPIARSAFETYLTFHYIFVEENISDEEKKIRHILWRLSSLSNRQRLTAFSSAMRNTLNDNQVAITSLTQELVSSHLYETVASSRTQTNISNGNRRIDWKPNGGWSSLAGRASFNTRFFDDAYNTLSAVSHSDEVIVNYINNTRGGDVQIQLTKTAVSLLNVVTACFIKDYAVIYPGASQYISSHVDLQTCIEVLKHLHGDAYETARVPD